MAHPNGTEFSTTTRLRTGPRLHYAERGDKEGEATSSSFMPTPTRGSPTAGCFPFFPPPTTPSRPTSAGTGTPTSPSAATQPTTSPPT